MKNKEKTIHIVFNTYLTFELSYQRKRIALWNIDAEDCTLYDCKGDTFLNSLLKEFKGKKLNLKLIKDAGVWQIISNSEIMVNGVACHKKVLKDGDKIYLGEYRLIFMGTFTEEMPQNPISVKSFSRKRLLRLIEAAAFVLSVSFLWYCTSINHNSDIDLAENEFGSIDHESELPYNFSEELDGLEDVPYIKKYNNIEDDTYSLRVYAPGEDPYSQKLDILFIHAHPDDESLDYGLYMAEASAAGKSVGIIVFTDGDSGFDTYPDRPIDSFYKDSYLKGAELAKVRVKEAERALTVLGVDVYLRLGLWNRAYTSEEVSKSIGTLITEWGGQDQLISKLVHIMEIFRPDVIVSPDGPCNAREHFEHEAVGFISELAVSLYREKNPDKLDAYLKLIDVKQLEAYPDVSLLEINAGEEKKYRDLKYAALMMHQTQADASYFGIKRLNDFPVEYYMVQYCSETPVDATLAFFDKKMEETLSNLTF